MTGTEIRIRGGRCGRCVGPPGTTTSRRRHPAGRPGRAEGRRAVARVDLRAGIDRAVVGDREAARKLVTSNLRLVVKIAMDYRKYWMNLLDLVQEGNIGLMNAIEKFDVDRGYHFISYAVWWIKQAILKAIC